MSTPCLRGQPHSPLDYSVLELEAEDLSGDDSPFLKGLERDMEVLSAAELAKRYPELLFTWTRGSKKPAKVDYAERNGRGYMAARWRTL